MKAHDECISGRAADERRANAAPAEIGSRAGRRRKETKTMMGRVFQRSTFVLLALIIQMGLANSLLPNEGRASMPPAVDGTIPTVVDVCEVEFALADQVTLGSLQFDVDYEAAAGEFLGSGPDVGNGGTLECFAALEGSLAAFTDDDEARTLTAGVVKQGGFTGPVTVAMCLFVPDQGADVAPEELLITVTDAKDPDVVPVLPVPEVEVSSIDCWDCGNGEANAGEECDDGNVGDGDGCSAQCVVESGWECAQDEPICQEICGDGILVGAEHCDDGNTLNGDGCSARCTLERGFDCTDPPSTCDAVCGDSLVVGSETCDDGDDQWSQGEACGANCTWLECCDPDGSGSVTASDALLVLLKATGLRPTCETCVCDALTTTGTAPITAVDALVCLRTAVNIPTALACPPCSVEIIINEVSFMPSRDSEFVELLNRGVRDLDISGFEIADEDDTTYTIPAALPPVPPGAFVVVSFDGLGAASNDVDFADNKALLHTGSPELAGDVFDDDEDSVFLFSASDHSGATLVDSVVWGDVGNVDNQISRSVRPDSSFPQQVGEAIAREPYFGDSSAHWAVYHQGDLSPGAPNPVNRPRWFAPRDATTTSDRRPVLAWQHSGVDIVAYELDCDEDAAFGSPEITVRTFTQRNTPIADLPNGTISCRVRAINSASVASEYATISFNVVSAPSIAALSHQTSGDSFDLGVPWLQQKKDSRLVCLHDFGLPHSAFGSVGAHAWDAPHTVRGCDHDNEYCCRAALSMVAAYYGGTLSQDRISYECYDGSVMNNENDDLRHGWGMWPTCASTSMPGSNLMEWALNLAAGTVTGIQNPLATSVCPDCNSGAKPTFSAIKGWIDDLRPIIWVTHTPFHCHVVDGYTDPDGKAGTSDDRIHVIDPWTGLERVELHSQFNFGPNAAYFVPPAGAAARSEEAGMSQDPDFDGLPRFTGSYEKRTYNAWGLMSFDETNRFMTGASAFDTDNDCIDDKVEVWSYTFHTARVADSDSDGSRAESDNDSDGHGLCDGDDRQEDRNKDGDVDSGETDPFKSDETLTGCQCTPLGGGAADLIPEAGGTGPIGFCKLAAGKLRVTVRNQGGGAAGASMTKVTFSPGGAVVLATPAIAAHASASVDFTIPSACWNADCDFTIQVDSGAQVTETDETNNSANGVCPG